MHFDVNYYLSSHGISETVRQKHITNIGISSIIIRANYAKLLENTGPKAQNDFAQESGSSFQFSTGVRKVNAMVKDVP